MSLDSGKAARGLTLKVTGAPRWRSRARRHEPARPVDRKVRQRERWM